VPLLPTLTREPQGYTFQQREQGLKNPTPPTNEPGVITVPIILEAALVAKRLPRSVCRKPIKRACSTCGQHFQRSDSRCRTRHVGIFGGLAAVKLEPRMKEMRQLVSGGFGIESTSASKAIEADF
jgi:hypothetical protein